MFLKEYHFLEYRKWQYNWLIFSHASAFKVERELSSLSCVCMYADQKLGIPQ